MKIRKAVLLLACAVSWGIAVWFAGRLWAAYPLVSVRSDVPVTGGSWKRCGLLCGRRMGRARLFPLFGARQRDRRKAAGKPAGSLPFYIAASMTRCILPCFWRAVPRCAGEWQMRGLNRCRVAALGQRGRAGAGIGDRRRHLPRVRALSQQRQPGPVRGKP